MADGVREERGGKGGRGAMERCEAGEGGKMDGWRVDGGTAVAMVW